MLKVVEYIKKYGLDKLAEEFSISVKRHQDYNNLVLLKYSQLNTPRNHPITNDCRGLILDEDDDWRVVCYPYTRFFNYGEGHAAEIDWPSARVYEKVDGSLMSLYHYDGRWHVSSSGTPDASGEIMGTKTTFRELFWRVWQEMKYQRPTDTNTCYMFELMTPFNRIVVRHQENKIILHGARRLTDFKELNPVVEAHNNNWQCVPIHPLGSWDDIQRAARELDPMEAEGYVVCDSQYRRVKVKSPQYVAVAHMRDAFSTRRLLEIVRTNENSEFLSYYPEYSQMYYEIRIKYERLLGEMEGFYDGIKHIEDRKEFALLATTKKYSGALFSMKFGKVSDLKTALADMNIRLLEEWLHIKLVDLSNGSPQYEIGDVA